MSKVVTDYEVAVGKAKTSVANFRREFEERKKTEYQEASALVRLTLYQAVWHAHDQGISVSDIARGYGTTDRATIYAILAKRAELAYATQHEGPTLRVEPNTGARADGYPNAWTVTVQAWDDFRLPEALSALEKMQSDSYSGYVSFFVRPTGTVYIIEAEHPGSPLHTEILAWQDDSPFIAQVKAQMNES